VNSVHQCLLPSVLWHCWLGVRRNVWHVKTEWRGAGVFMSLEWVQMICIWSSWCHCHPIICCFIKIQIGLTLLVLTYPGCIEKEATKLASVYLCCNSPHLQCWNKWRIKSGNSSRTKIQSFGDLLAQGPLEITTICLLWWNSTSITWTSSAVLALPLSRYVKQS